jgi:hypothetical protein
MALSIFVITLISPLLQAQPSFHRVFTCSFVDSTSENELLRMKDYFDSGQNIELGKVEHFQNSQILESRATKIYDIPLWQQPAYLKIWEAADLRVDAQLSTAGNNSTFFGTYSIAASQRKIFCTLMN